VRWNGEQAKLFEQPAVQTVVGVAAPSSLQTGKLGSWSQSLSNKQAYEPPNIVPTSTQTPAAPWLLQTVSGNCSQSSLIVQPAVQAVDKPITEQMGVD